MMLRVLVFLALLGSGLAQATPLVTLSQMNDGLGPELQILKDESGQFDIESFLSGNANARFHPAEQQVVNLGLSGPVNWFRVDIDVDAASLRRQWFADIDYPVLDWVELYLVREGRIISRQLSGDQVPASKRPMDSRSLSFPLPFEDTGLHQLYIRLDTQSSHSLPLRILSGRDFAHRSDVFQFWFGVYFGIVTITMLFSGLVAALLRSSMFLDYSAFVLFAGLGLPLSLTGYGSQMIWGEYPLITNAMTPLTMGVALMFALSLTRKTLDTRKFNPTLDRLFLVEQGICLLVALSPLFVSYALAIRMGTVMGAACSLSVLIASIYAASHKRRTAILFLFAWSWYLIAVLVKVLTVFGEIPFTTITSYAMQIGLSILIVFLAAALGEMLHSERRLLLEAQLQSMRDANERRQAELEAKTRTDFLAKMSHELRTPMNAVIGFSELGMRRDNSERRGEFLARIHTAATGLLSLINDILDFSKIEAGRLSLEHEPISLPRIFDKLSTMFLFQAESKDIDLVVELDDSVPPHILGDSLRLEQILTNLVSNAIKFTDSGGVEVLAHCEEHEGRQHLKVRVRDTGIGITMDDTERLFQAFSQADDSITRRFGGSGLGLVICKQLVTLMGGEIGIISEHGQGSEFWFRIPIKETQLRESAPPDDGVMTDLPALADTAAGSRLKGLHVLLAEDNELNQKLIESLLGGLGVELTIVDNGKKVLEALEQGRFDIILMDIFMPEMDGYTATREIRAQHRFDGLPIIAVSASVADHDRASCFEAGMNDFVAKPVRAEELIQCMLRQTGQAAAVSRLASTAHEDKERQILDTEEGLSYCDGKRELYRQILNDFRCHYLHADSDIAAALQAERREEARRMAHTIKGLSASLGMQRLNLSALELEKALKTPGATPSVDAFAKDLQDALAAADEELDKAPVLG